MLTNLKRCVFFFPVPNTHRTHTIGRGRWAGPRHRAGPRHHSGRAEQGAGQGARSAAAAGCVPAPTRPASINSWQFGARTSAAARTCRFLAADSHSKLRDLLQTGASSVCVCARARKHVGTRRSERAQTRPSPYTPRCHT